MYQNGSWQHSASMPRVAALAELGRSDWSNISCAVAASRVDFLRIPQHQVWCSFFFCLPSACSFVRLLVSLLVEVGFWRVSLRSSHACHQAILMICCCSLVSPCEATPKQAKQARVPDYIDHALRRMRKTKGVCLRHHLQQCCEDNLRLNMATNR